MNPAPSLETIPPEILLGIIQRVHFSPRNFKALTLVNRRFHDVMAGRGSRLLGDIAALQCPHALRAYRLTFSPFDVNDLEISVSIRVLRRFMYASLVIEFIISTLECIATGTNQENRELRKYLSATGWQESLRLGLHTLDELEALVCEVARVPGLHEGLSAGSRPPPDDKMSSPCAAFVSHWPATTALAVRHTTFITLAMLKAIDSELEIRRIDPQLPPTSTNLFTLETMGLTIERDLFQITTSCARAWSGNFSLQGTTDALVLRARRDVLQELFREAHDQGPNRKAVLPRCDQMVTTIIREEVLGKWDHFVENNPQTVRDLQSDNVHDPKALRAFVERFVK